MRGRRRNWFEHEWCYAPNLIYVPHITLHAYDRHKWNLRDAKPAILAHMHGHSHACTLGRTSGERRAADKMKIRRLLYVAPCTFSRLRMSHALAHTHTHTVLAYGSGHTYRTATCEVGRFCFMTNALINIARYMQSHSKWYLKIDLVLLRLSDHNELHIFEREKFWSIDWSWNIVDFATCAEIRLSCTSVVWRVRIVLLARRPTSQASSH